MPIFPQRGYPGGGCPFLPPPIDGFLCRQVPWPKSSFYFLSVRSCYFSVPVLKVSRDSVFFFLRVL